VWDHYESVQDLIRAVADDGSFSASEMDRLQRVTPRVWPAVNREFLDALARRA
jgi:hypothetical protein